MKEIKVSKEFMIFLCEYFVYLKDKDHDFLTWLCAGDKVLKKDVYILYIYLVNNDCKFNDNFFKKYSSKYVYDREHIIEILEEVKKIAKKYMQDTERLKNEGISNRYSIPVKDEIFKELDTIITFLINYDKE